jgi:2-methylcitrate dehydratase PrpD
VSATQSLLDFATAAHRLPDAVRADAARLLADTLAVGAAGAASPEAQAMLGVVQAWGAGADARLLCGSRLPAPSVAWFNGFAIHSLEWDAVHEGAVVHALSVVTAALLAASDRKGGSDPDAFLTALAIGVDVASLLGLAATGPMRFFRPATAGIIGAALAVARIEGVPVGRFADVLGLAYSFAGGTMQAHVEASIALPLQIANAARSAITAVDLVKAGMTGPHDVLEGPFGYSALIEPLDLAPCIAGLGARWNISAVSIKPFPSGRASHGALGALAELRAQGAVSLETVAGIELFAPPLIHRLVGRLYADDATPSYQRLCLAFLAPLMLRDGLIDPRLRETDTALAARVCVTLDDNRDGNALGPQRLVVTLSNGQIIERAIPATLGSPDAPLSPAQSATKYELCRALAPEADARLFGTPLDYATDPQ